VRILVTNDDGIHAPGLGALTSALARWAKDGAHAEDCEVFVVAPLANHSGASAAVGAFYERDAITYRTHRLEEAPDVAAVGIDAPPALATIVALLGAFGAPPEIVVSGINLGANVGGAILHSGTVGAALTAAALGRRALAVSIRAGTDPVPWETAASVATTVLPALFSAPPSTALNLNVPAVALEDLRGVRHASVSAARLVRGASGPGAIAEPVDPEAHPDESHEGTVRLALGPSVPTLGPTEDEDPSDDASFVAHGYAALTPLVGTHEATGVDSIEVVTHALRLAAQGLPSS
jgi:5'-nucleotidase